MSITFPKIRNASKMSLDALFNGGVITVTEKLDGSQLNFCKSGNVYPTIQSKSCTITARNGVVSNGMFDKAFEVLSTKNPALEDGVVYHSEYLRKKKHNTLAYNNVPRNHIALYGATKNGRWLSHAELYKQAESLDIDVVPCLFHGVPPVTFTGDNYKELDDWCKGFFTTQSYLGGCLLEGVVISNFSTTFTESGVTNDYVTVKFVRDEFKELHGSKNRPITANRLCVQDVLKDFTPTEARWEKAVSRLKESGRFTNSVKDIGPLIAEIKEDAVAEDLEQFKDALYNIYRKEFMENQLNGFVSWYKQKVFDNAYSTGCGNNLPVG